MHVIVATDGSRQSLAAARHLKSFADPGAITDVTVLAVIRPLAAVAFADELSGSEHKASWETLSFRDAADNAVAIVAAEFAGWGPRVHQRVRSGSPANEIIKAARQHDAGLVVVAAGARGISEGVLIGSTAQRVQHYAPCPVLVVRPRPKRSAKKKAKAKKATGATATD
jgi:nucleotide-binding universal stress UspA family protein